MSLRRTSGADGPLFAWGDAIRAARRLRRRRGAVIGGAAAIGIALLSLRAAFPPAPRLVWNASASAPIGLYRLTPGKPSRPGEMVVAQVPARWRRLAAKRGYLPANVPLVKRVAAVAGDEVCAVGQAITVNGRPVTERRIFDGRGRRMPFWLGCIRLRGRQLLLLMAAPDSFDGRYFGVTEGRDIIGKARLIWAW